MPLSIDFTILLEKEQFVLPFLGTGSELVGEQVVKDVDVVAHAVVE